MVQPTASLAILFADINGSTALYDKLGDRMARDILSRCTAIMVAEVAAHQGVLVKTIGDEIMCTFFDADAALRAACAMQLAVETGKPGGEHPIYIHIGLHYGEVIREEGDVYGDAVNVAARLTAMTRAREITTSKATANLLSPSLQNKVRKVFRANLKGKQEEVEICRVAWELDDTLSTRVGLVMDRLSSDYAELLLQYRDVTRRLNDQNRSAVIGRGQDCEIVIPGDMASRHHARIEFRSGKFMLVDHSVNGTYIRWKDGRVIRLEHEETMLHGSGSISAGQPFDAPSAEWVEFSAN
jgi:class 3 adenylate cyclase